MERDEAGTLARVKAVRSEVVEAETGTRGGRVFKTTGDGALAEFPSAVAAVEAAIAVQAALAGREAERAEENRIHLRIGVSLGDVMVDGDDLYGNGVNVAARMEALAEPGGICVSGNVHEHVETALEAGFEDLGAQTVKNIARPVHCFRVTTGARGVSPPRISDKPSIVVLPFANMSGDAEQEFFSDGITEDVITALSRIRQLFVMARNTAFTYKGQAVDVRAVARELGVRYVLEGSVRRAGERVRITAQLIDGASGDHLWAERYDRKLEDIFAVQDEITEIVAGTLEPEITKAEFERQRHAPPESLDAWQLFQLGVYHFNRLTPEDDAAAERHLEAAIDRDPGFSPSHSMLARFRTRHANAELAADMDRIYASALATARTAVSLDPEDAHAHTALGFTLKRSDLTASIKAFEQALTLNPNLSTAHFGLSATLLEAGRTSEARDHVTTAMRLSPRDPLTPLYRGMHGAIQFADGDYDGALALLPRPSEGKMARARRSALRVAALALQGREAEMRAEKAQLLATYPHLTIALALQYNGDVGGHLAEGLAAAGIPA